MPSVGWRWLFCVRSHVVWHVEFAIKVDLNRGTSLLCIVFIRKFTSGKEDRMALEAFVIVLKGFLYGG